MQRECQHGREPRVLAGSRMGFRVKWLPIGRRTRCGILANSKHRRLQQDQAGEQTSSAYNGAPPDYIPLATTPEPAHFPSARASSPRPRRRASDAIRSSESRSVSPEVTAEEQAANDDFIEDTEPMAMEDAALANQHLQGWTAHNGLRFGTPGTTAAHRVVSTDHPVPLG